MKNSIIKIETAFQRLRRLNEEPTKYAEAVSSLDMSMATIQKQVDLSRLVFNIFPAHYEQYTECCSRIVSHCTTYATQVHSQLESCPSSLLSSNSTLKSYFSAALGNVNSIIAKLENEGDIAADVNALRMNLRAVVNNMKPVIQTLNALLSNLKTLESESFAEIVKDLKDILDDIVIDTLEYNDAKRELELTKAIIENEIKSQTTAAIISGVTGALVIVATVISIIAVIASGGTATGAVLTGVAGFFTLVAPIVGVSLTAPQVTEAQKKLDTTITMLENNAKDTLMLDSYKSDVEKAVAEMDEVFKYLTEIKSTWEEVEAGYNSIEKYIEKSYANMYMEQWAKIQNLLNESIAAISSLDTLLESMRLKKIKYANIKLAVGMTAEEVAEALKSAELVSYIEYMMAI